MVTIEDIKEKVGKLVAEKGLSYNYVSLKLGKNPSYLQKFVKEKSPKRLDEKFRKDLAILLEVDEQELTDIPLLPTHLRTTTSIAEKIVSLFDSDTVKIDVLDVTACCGDGIENLPEKVCGHWKLPISEFKSITSGNPNNIKMLRVQGDSMQPTINEGDWVWVDTSNNFIGSDGLYMIRMATGLAVKRLQSGLNDVVIRSDNASYSDITASVGEVQIVGKVVYILNGRRV